MEDRALDFDQDWFDMLLGAESGIDGRNIMPNLYERFLKERLLV